jgi:hypothetical protein
LHSLLFPDAAVHLLSSSYTGFCTQLGAVNLANHALAKVNFTEGVALTTGDVWGAIGATNTLAAYGSVWRAESAPSTPECCEPDAASVLPGGDGEVYVVMSVAVDTCCGDRQVSTSM